MSPVLRAFAGAAFLSQLGAVRNKIKNMKKIFLIGIGILLLFVAAIYYYNNLVQINFPMQFNGKVDKVVYSVKGEPTILINGKIFNLPVNLWDFDHKNRKRRFIDKVERFYGYTINKI
jgi:hypothetical protein